MKRFLKRVTLFFLFPLGLGLTLFGLEPEASWRWSYIKGDCAGHGQFIHHRLYQDERPIDVAFIGSSRTINGPMDERLTKELGESVATLGYCRFGRDLSYQIIKELLAEKSPRLIILEVREGESRKGHPIYPYLATSKEVLKPKGGFKWSYFEGLYQGLSTRLDYARDLLWQKPFPPNKMERKFGYGPSNAQADSLMMAKRKVKEYERYGSDFDNPRRRSSLGYSRAYFDAIQALVAEHNTSIAFLYLPGYGSALETPYEKDWYLTAGSLLIPPQEIYDNWQNWLDGDHLNDQGSVALTDWLIQQNL